MWYNLTFDCDLVLSRPRVGVEVDLDGDLAGATLVR